MFRLLLAFTIPDIGDSIEVKPREMGWTDIISLVQPFATAPSKKTQALDAYR